MFFLVLNPPASSGYMIWTAELSGYLTPRRYHTYRYLKV